MFKKNICKEANFEGKAKVEQNQQSNKIGFSIVCSIYILAIAA